MRSTNGTLEFDLNALRIFAAAVEGGGVTEAARRLALPKSSVSRQLRALEAQIGQSLLERHGRGLRATAAGRRLHETARGALGTLEAIRRDLLAPPLAGRLRLRAPVMLGRGLLTGIVAEFLDRHPGLTLEVAWSDRFEARPEEEADIACCVGVLPGPGFARESVGFAEARLYAAPALLASFGAPATPASLAALPLLGHGCAPGGSARWTLTDARGAAESLAVTPRLVANDPDLLLAAAIAGRGVCPLPGFLAEPALQAGQLLRVLPGHWAERHEVIVARAPRPREPALSPFADHVAQRLRDRLR
jgi:DNA-binding transcriptional LysR family regulator